MWIGAVKVLLDSSIALDRVRNAAGHLTAPFEEIEIGADVAFAASFLAAVADFNLRH